MVPCRIMSFYHVHHPGPPFWRIPYHQRTSLFLVRSSLSVEPAMRKIRGPDRVLAFQQFLDEKYDPLFKTDKR